MPNMTYQYDHSGRSPRSGSSRVRFYLLLTVITALMAGGIGWFVFSQKKEKAKSQPAAEEKSVASENIPAKTAKPGKKEQPKQEKKEMNPATPEISEKNLPVQPAEPNEKLPESGKGEILPTDPPPENDKALLSVPQPVTESIRNALKEAQQLLEQKKYQTAVEVAGKALPAVQENSGIYREFWKTLAGARCSLIAEGSEHAGIIRHSIRSGESLSRIAARNNTTIELLKKLNHLSGNRLYVGRGLKILPGPWKIKVEKSARLLKLYRADKLYLVFDAGIGRMGKTPSAEFAVSHRLYHPDWYTSDGRIYKYGDPENQLGSSFLKLALFSSPGRPLEGFGIHGCKDESTVGRSLSNGCVRLRNADVELLYYLVPAGTRVEFAE